MDHLGHVLIRSDLNVPTIEGKVLNNFRLNKALENYQEIEKISESVTYVSHLGRPKIEDVVSKHSLTLKPIGLEMSNILNKKVDTIALCGILGTRIRDLFQALDIEYYDHEDYLSFVCPILAPNLSLLLTIPS